MTKPEGTLRVCSLIWLLVGFVSCNCASEYRGDGVLVDNGATTATHRYVLQLGRVSETFSVLQLANFPDETFTFGVQIVGMDSDSVRSTEMLGDFLVDLALMADDGSEVFRTKGRLAEWTWTSGLGPGGYTSAFAYLLGTQEGVPLAEGGERLGRVGVGPHGGWGTYFKPRCEEEYRLEVSVSDAAFLAEHDVQILATGGGWK